MNKPVESSTATTERLEHVVEGVEEQPVYLSIIVPAYNEEKRLPATLEEIDAFLRTQPYTYEVIVVENGSTDRTTEVAEAFAAEHPYVRVLHSRKGKGAAVKTGMLNARGEYLFICDADLSMPIEEVTKFLPPALDDYDIAIGSREVPGARRYDEPFYRHLQGRVFNWIVRVLAVPGIQDTQCGFKCFRRDVALDVFPYQTTDGWSFDVEVLYIARARGYRLVEVPINWYYKENSRINPVKDALSMLWEVLKIRWNAWRGLYNRKGERRNEASK